MHIIERNFTAVRVLYKNANILDLFCRGTLRASRKAKFDRFRMHYTSWILYAYYCIVVYGQERGTYFPFIIPIDSVAYLLLVHPFFSAVQMHESSLVWSSLILRSGNEDAQYNNKEASLINSAVALTLLFIKPCGLFLSYSLTWALTCESLEQQKAIVYSTCTTDYCSKKIFWEFTFFDSHALTKMDRLPSIDRNGKWQRSQERQKARR